MYVDNYMYDMSLNNKSELVVLIDIPKERQHDLIENVEIRISETDINRMKYVFDHKPKE